MKKYSKFLALIPAILVFLILTALFSDLFVNANQFLYFGSGDALKNYFHFAVYTKYGANFHLQEVNYPFGEHIIFLDNQPILAFLAKQFTLSNYAIALVNLMPFISLVFTALIIFLIQRFLKLPLIFNLLSSVIITLLSPQILRFESHHALAYTFVIPLTILLLLYAHRSKYYFIALAILTLFVSFIHLYYLLIILVLVSAYSFLVLINRKKLSYFLTGMLSILMPFIIFKAILNYTDTIKDRPETSLNMNIYRSTFEGVFIPNNGSYAEVLNTVFNIAPKNFESYAYVGKLGLPILFFLLISLLIKLVKGKKTIKLFENNYLFELCWAAALVWIFAMYYPLKGVIDFAGEYVSAIKQFRSLGRLAWIFFYVFSILISFKLLHFYNYIKSRLNLKFALLFIFIAFAFWASDFKNSFVNIHTNYSKHKSENIFNASLNTTKKIAIEKHINFSEYQASLTLPTFHVGSEIAYYEGSNSSIQEVFSLAYFYQLPFISTYSSRVSKNQFMEVENIIKNGCLSNFNINNKPLLIVADINLLSQIDSTLISQSKYLYHNSNIYYYKYAAF